MRPPRQNQSKQPKRGAGNDESMTSRMAEEWPKNGMAMADPGHTGTGKGKGKGKGGGGDVSGESEDGTVAGAWGAVGSEPTPAYPGGLSPETGSAKGGKAESCMGLGPADHGGGGGATARS